MDNVWRDHKGYPLRYQRGDMVRIDYSGDPSQVYSIGFLTATVVGYDITRSGDNVISISYYLEKMGHHPICVREDRLDAAYGGKP